MVLAIVVVLLGLAAAAFSPLLGVRHVRISGNTRLETALLEDLAGIRTGSALLRVDLAGVAERLETQPWVANARVVRSLPTTIRIEVTEERPLMVLRADQGAAIVSRTGRILEFSPGRGAPQEWTTSVAQDLPVVITKGPMAADSPSDADLPGRRGSDAVIELTRVVRNLPVSVASRLSQMVADDPSAIELVMEDGSTVLVGPSEDVSAKMAALSAVLVGVDDRCVDHIDVRNPKQATVTRTEGCEPVE